jgi:hypothetical protein
MGKASRIQRTIPLKADSVALPRGPGFYLVTGVDTVAGGGEQPAYWDGKFWRLIGWDGSVSPTDVRTFRPIL